MTWLHWCDILEHLLDNEIFSIDPATKIVRYVGWRDGCLSIYLVN
jgi:hypothetical protein